MVKFFISCLLLFPVGVGSLSSVKGIHDPSILIRSPSILFCEVVRRGLKSLEVPRVRVPVLPCEIRLRIGRDVSISTLSALEYVERACTTLEKAVKLVEECYLDEACEEAWRAMLDAVKALSVLLWGIVPESHKATRLIVDEVYKALRELWRSMPELRKIAKSPQSIITAFKFAEDLHDHYYEQTLSKSTIMWKIKVIAREVRKIRRIVLKLQNIFTERSALYDTLSTIPHVVWNSVRGVIIREERLHSS